MSIVFDPTNKTPLTEGGEGIIYEYNGKIIKIYKPSVNIKSKENKVKLLINKSLPKEVVAPEDIVTNRKGQFIGYLMQKVEGEEVKRLANKKFVTANNITTKDILALLVKIQNVCDELHKLGIYIGDLNDQNILFDKQFNAYFIDCDSWTVDNEKCEVAMDLFKDPQLVSNNFNADTDNYAFSVLAWKTLTRIHPFGGTMNPDINIIDRMAKGISVIGNPKVTIPKTIKPWRNLSPQLITNFKDIFSNNTRIFGDSLSELLQNLKYCKTDKEYYYSKFTTCPLCDANAKVQSKPQSKGSIRGLKILELLNGSNIKIVIDRYTYIDVDNYVVDICSGTKVPYQYGNRYYFTSDGYVITDQTDSFTINSQTEYIIEKKYKTPIIVENNHIYYISKQSSFVDMTVLKMGNSIKNICKCSNISYFEVCNGQYCIVNFYNGRIIVNINGRNTEINYNDDIVNYGIHYDNVSAKWLIVLENKSGIFTTYIIKGNEIVHSTDQIKYACSLSNLCISNSTLFIPIDGKIRGYSYEKSIFKDFECNVVNDNSRLIKTKNKFIVVNDENIYQVG